MDKIFGLINNGNTCYQNAAIQSIFCIDELINFLINKKKVVINILKKNNNDINNINDLILTWIILVKLNEDNQIIDPNIISKCIKNYKIIYKDKITMPYRNEFPNFEQLDSYDYINAILTILHKELKVNFLINQEYLEKIKKDLEEYNDINNKVIEYNKENILKYSLLTIENNINNGYSIINKIFSGLYINISECENCGYKNFSFTYSDTLDLDLFCSEKHIIFSNLYECLDNQMNINLYSNENIHKKNTGHLRCYNYYKFFYPPDCLIIRLKRFTDKGKINNNIDIPINLNIDKYIHMFSDKNNNYNYRLCSAIIHLGGGLGGGHYISIGYKNNMWLEFNDSNVSRINEYHIDKYLSRAYILFYQKI